MSSYSIADALPVLRRTPHVLRALLLDLPPVWLHGRDGPKRWSPAEVLVHLIEGERWLWVPRMEVILSDAPDRRFPVFEREANFDRATSTPIADLLAEFETKRGESVAHLEHRALTAADLARTAQHPDLGQVTLLQLLSTWTAHDLAHLTQVTRTMARQYADAVGPWKQYLRIMQPDAT